MKARWPYPLTIDGKVEEGSVDKDKKTEEEPKKVEEKKDKEKKDDEKEEEKKDDDKEEDKKEEKEEEKEEEKKEEVAKEEEKNDDAKAEGGNNKELWQFKVKRYPWAVSYGNKHLDKIVDAVKVAAGEVRQAPEIPEPANMDAESAKSVLAFLLKVKRYRKESLSKIYIITCYS